MGRLLSAATTLLAAFFLAAGALAGADQGSPTDREAADAHETGTASGATRSANRPVASVSARPRAVRVARFDQPVEIRSAPGFPRLMFVVEQRGRVMVLWRGRRLPRPFLNITPRVSFGGEQGLLSIAFPPDYRRSGRFYVYFNDRAGDIRVVEFRRRNAIRARHNTARLVLRIPHPDHSNHNGGQMHFLGHHLYFGTGDGGGGGDPNGNAQNLNSLLGKLIRIDPRRRGRRAYRIPAGNPFVGRAGRAEIFAYGLRNPFRWSFDRVSAKRVRIAIGDVGQNRFEEINYLALARARGANFGWNRWEGFEPFEGGGPGTIKPALVLPNPPNCSVIGGLVVRDRQLPALRGRYLFSDFCTGRILGFKPRPGGMRARPTGINIPNMTSFGDNAAGAVFVTTLDGDVFRIRQ